jgi:pimeloyl-ACP methyl ester carboxylesterase
MPSIVRRLILILGLLITTISIGHADTACTPVTGQMEIDGGTLHYDTAGTGPAVLLLHGLFAQKEQWREWLCLLAAAGHRAIAPDLPGYGQSGGFAIADYGLKRQVELLRRLTLTLDIDRLDLAGNSMGGTIAVLYAEAHPEQVRSLAFIGAPFGIVDWGPDVAAAIRAGINPFIPVDDAELDLELALLFVDPPVLPAEIKQRLVTDYVARNRHYQQIWNVVGLYGRTLADRDIVSDKRTLVLWGRQDRVFPVAGLEGLSSRLPNGHLVPLPDAGHLPHFDNTSEIFTIYLKFLSLNE